MRFFTFCAIALSLILSSSYADENRISLGSRKFSEEAQKDIEKNTKDAFKQALKNEKSLSYYDYDYYPPVYLSYGCHLLTSVSMQGDSFTIEDGSQWRAKPGYYRNILSWASTDTLIIVKNDSVLSNWFGNYKYKIVNQTLGYDSVEVKLCLGPLLDSPYTLFVKGIDAFHMQVLLSDGSVWKIQDAYASGLNNWQIDDGIIIGTNYPWYWNYDYINILINVNLNDDVPAAIRF